VDSGAHAACLVALKSKISFPQVRRRCEQHLNEVTMAIQHCDDLKLILHNRLLELASDAVLVPLKL
jgi:hypothetical protein